MAHTKSAGTAHLGRDSQPKYLGIKLHDGQTAEVGQIIVRQNGGKILPGLNVKQGKDDTLYAMAKGLVKFKTKRKTRFDGAQRVVKVVSVEPSKK
jgi:large subunit ribosomal protein L27